MTDSNGSQQKVLEQTSEYQRALEFMRSAEGREGVDYDWALDYAKMLWDYRNKVFAALDEKAEAIIKYLGGGTGLFALGVLAKIDSSNYRIAIASLPSLGLSLLATWMGMSAKKPFLFPSVPTVEDVKSYADFYQKKEFAIGAFLGQWGFACEKARLSCELKATQIDRAMIVAFIALGFLLLPVIVAIGCRL